MENIRDVLNRRNDLSTFVVHLSRDHPTSAKENLRSIIGSGLLRGSTPMGWAANEDDQTDSSRQSQRAISFSETPLEHIYSLVADIFGRQVELKPYGLAFTKMVARRTGINPVWYVDRTAGATHQWKLSNAINKLRDQAVASGDFHSSPIAEILPFFQVMGTWPDHKVEFWWEREWRHVGDLSFDIDQVALWLCPETEIAEFEALLRDQAPDRTPRCIDPRWGLEQIVARLVGGTQITPFEPH